MTTTPSVRPRSDTGPLLQRGDRIFGRTAKAAGVLILVILAGVAAFLLVEALPALTAPAAQLPGGEGLVAYIGPLLFGTLLAALLALVVATPLAVAIALFITQYAPRRLAQGLGYLVDLLAAIPSIVYGLCGIFVFAPWMARTGMPFLKDYFGWVPIFQGPAFGVSFLTAGLILAIMVLPTVIAISRDVLLAVPNSQREGMLALGATKWESIRGAVLPFARAGVIGATILALGRAVGETMAVTMVIGNRPQITEELFRPGYTMASVIANEFNESQSALHTQSMIEIGLILFFVTILINFAARLLVWKVAANQRLTGI